MLSKFIGAAVSFAAVALGAAVPAHASPTRYHVTVVAPSLPASGTAYAINSKAVVAGYNDNASTFARDGTVTSLGTLGGPLSFAYGINTHGVVVGMAYDTAFKQRAFRWADGTMGELEQPGASIGSTASAINDNGQVAGFATMGNGLAQGVVWKGSSIAATIAPLPGMDYDQATAISAVGHVAGTSGVHGTGLTHAFLFADGQLTDLQAGDGTLTTLGYGINASDEVVGQMQQTINGKVVTQAFLHAGGLFTPLGFARPGDTWSVARAINDDGVVVGQSGGGTPYTAFVYDGTTMSELITRVKNPAGWVLVNASAINRKGQITGNGLYNGKWTMFLATPVKE